MTAAEINQLQAIDFMQLFADDRVSNELDKIIAMSTEESLKDTVSEQIKETHMHIVNRVNTVHLILRGRMECPDVVNRMVIDQQIPLFGNLLDEFVNSLQLETQLICLLNDRLCN